MERMYRLVLFGLFILGFVGAVAGGNTNRGTESPVVSLLRDVRLAQEAHMINSGTWSIDADDSQEETLDQVEKLFQDEKPVKTVFK